MPPATYAMLISRCRRLFSMPLAADYYCRYYCRHFIFDDIYALRLLPLSLMPPFIFTCLILPLRRYDAAITPSPR